MKKFGLIIIAVSLMLLGGCKSKENNNTNEKVEEVDVNNLQEKDLEYAVMRENAVILKCVSDDAEEEILYSSDKKLAVGTYCKGKFSGFNNIETAKDDLETILKEVYKCSYYDVQIVEDRLEYEYISTNIACFKNVGLNYSLDTIKENREKEGYKCIVENEK